MEKPNPSLDLSSSPEFEFWMVGNNPPSFPDPQNLLTADELFADGVILPLLPPPNPSPIPSPTPAPASSLPTKKWKQIFRTRRHAKTDATVAPKPKNAAATSATTSSSSTVGSGAELNINIWPFSRSRSSGSVASRPRVSVSAGRKSCSAPCSRSNSRSGDSSSSPAAAKRWGPLAGGIHVGRSAPVWQINKRASGVSGNTGNGDGGSKKTSGGGGGSYNGLSLNLNLNLNVNTCIGYGSSGTTSSGRQGSSCRVAEGKEEVVGGDRSDAITGVDGGGGGRGNGRLFGDLRAMFSKKVVC